MKGVFYVFIAILLASCSSSVISFYVVDEGRISFDSFSFYERDTKKLRPEQKALDSLIELSISNILVSKGFKEKSDSEVYVGYSITSGTSSSSSIDNPYYRSNYNRSYYPNNYNVTTTNYKEGVLLIEFWDSNDKLIWQGSKVFKVKKSIDTKELLVNYAKEITASFRSNL